MNCEHRRALPIDSKCSFGPIICRPQLIFARSRCIIQRWCQDCGAVEIKTEKGRPRWRLALGLSAPKLEGPAREQVELWLAGASVRTPDRTLVAAGLLEQNDYDTLASALGDALLYSPHSFGYAVRMLALWYLHIGLPHESTIEELRRSASHHWDA